MGILDGRPRAAVLVVPLASGLTLSERDPYDDWCASNLDAPTRHLARLRSTDAEPGQMPGRGWYE